MPKTKKVGSNLYVEYTEALNLTGKEVTLYNSYGSIVHIAPKKFTEHAVKLHDNLMVIVNSVSDGLAFGINPDNFVVPMSPAIRGRNDILLQRLQRPKDEAIVNYTPVLNGDPPDEVYI